MKRFSLILAVLCSAWFAGCNKDDDGGKTPEGTVSLMDGSIVINDHPDVKVEHLNSFPVGVSTKNEFSASSKRMGVKATDEDDDEDGSESGLKGNNYRFKLVNEIGTLTIDGVTVQATHVKITDDVAFVSYNQRGEPHRGGVVVYRYTIHDGPLDEVTVDVVPVSSLEMPKAEVSAIDYYNGKLYITGASEDPAFGYKYKDKFDYAFFMVMDLNADKSFKKDVPKTVVKLTSFQGTSIRALNNRIYITTGDGANNTKGGLYIYDATDYTQVKAILDKEHARSVDVDASNIFLMQANPARITKYDLNGNGGTALYTTTGESMQKDAKSETLAWDKYLFAAENESGLRMIFKDKANTLNASLDRPGANAETDVTNSVSMNSDLKKNTEGTDVQSNLLFLANGEKGLYWYDVMKDADGKDWIVPCKNNSFLLGEKEKGSANYVASRGNIVFVADGLGGLKVLYIGFNSGITPPPPDPNACADFMPYLYNETPNGKELLPEGKSVFRSDANPIIKTLFSDPADVPNYIEITNSTALYINFLGEWADWENALGYFVIPASVAKTPADEYAYYLSTVKPNMVAVIGGVHVLKDEYTIFRNVKALTVGSTYQIGGAGKTFNAGDRVVLFMAPDSWISQNDRVEVSFTPDSYDQIFFTHTGINLASGIGYSSRFGAFKGVQYNTFYSVDCQSMVMMFEDKHGQTRSNNGVDTDYNDCFFSITDNTENKKVANFVIPKYAITVKDGKPEILESSTLVP